MKFINGLSLEFIKHQIQLWQKMLQKINNNKTYEYKFF